MAFTTIEFAPLLPWWLIAAGIAVALPLLIYGGYRRARGIGWRTLLAAAVALVLLNPILIEEDRERLDDVAVLVVDDSPSHAIGERRARTQAAREAIEAAAENLDGLELRTVVVDDGAAAAGDDGTRLFEALARTVADLPPDRVAGVILVSDGQIHDVPQRGFEFDAPLHLLLSGERNEVDRRLIVEQAPSYGIVGDELSIAVRVDDPLAEGRPAPVTMRIDGERTTIHAVAVGDTHTLSFRLERAGPTAIEIEVEPGEEELTLLNNRALVVVNGVRDRLRVMLVSGEPSPGLRTWRNMLKADPAVDLVHFTVLRPPNKQDLTPVRDLSLIPFPSRELFAVNLREFDLIIFDRYHRRGILPMIYLENVIDYVLEGGAVLDSAGPEFATSASLYTTPLRAILPAEPTGEVMERSFRPRLTEAGRRHPVTAGLDGAGPIEGEPSWGHWYRQVDTRNREGTELMHGINDRPILVLDRVGEGRIAQLLSDHSWLWERGHDGGGPQADLLRRLVHWLMKEPELEEDDLRATVSANRVDIVRRSLRPVEGRVEVTTPSGGSVSIDLDDQGDGRATASFLAEEVGLHQLRHADRTAIAVVGTANPLEFTDLRTTAEHVGPLVDASGGAVAWLADGIPDLRQVRPDRTASGRGWIGVQAKRDYLVTGLRQTPLLPPALALLLVLGTLMLAWRSEGR